MGARSASAAPSPFGGGWRLEPEAFAAWIEGGGIFGAMAPPAADTSVETPADGAGEESVGATLGWLHLEQGYYSDAEEIFARVLSQSPGDARALEGQHAVDRRRRVDRKVARLRRLLAQLRREGR